MKSSRMSEMRSSRRVEVPFYKIDQEVVESVETKLDRVSKFIASLKSKSSKTHREYQKCIRKCRGEVQNKRVFALTGTFLKGKTRIGKIFDERRRT